MGSSCRGRPVVWCQYRERLLAGLHQAWHVGCAGWLWCPLAKLPTLCRVSMGHTVWRAQRSVRLRGQGCPTVASQSHFLGQGPGLAAPASAGASLSFPIPGPVHDLLWMTHITKAAAWRQGGVHAGCGPAHLWVLAHVHCPLTSTCPSRAYS